MKIESIQHCQRHNRHASNQDQPLNISIRLNDSFALRITIGVGCLNLVIVGLAECNLSFGCKLRSMLITQVESCLKE